MGDEGVLIMLRRLLVILFTSVLLVSLQTPAQAHPRGDIFEQGTYNDPYFFEDDSCGFTFTVDGRTRGRFVNYNVPGSDGQAFLNDNRYFFREVLTNVETGKRMYVSGHGRFREVAARLVDGFVWEFTSVETGTPFVIRNAWGKVVVMDRGLVVRRTVFDTLGDSQPGGEFISEEIVRTRGHFPSLDPEFDFCAVATKLIG